MEGLTALHLTCGSSMDQANIIVLIMIMILLIVIMIMILHHDYDRLADIDQDDAIEDDLDQSVTNIFKIYFKYSFGHLFVSIFLIQIYSDIFLCQFFGYVDDDASDVDDDDDDNNGDDHQASEYQTTTVVESLISQGSGVNAKDEQGITPLMQVDDNVKMVLVMMIGIC